MQYRNIGHAETDGQDTQHKTNRQRSGIAHEYFTPPSRVTEHIVVEKRNKCTQCHNRKRSIQPLSLIGKEYGKEEKSYTTQSRSQAIDSIDQVDGVGDKHNRKDGKWNPHRCRQLINSENTIQIVYPQSRGNQQYGTEYLNNELLIIANAYQIVGNTGQIQKQQATQTKREYGGITAAN